MSFDPFPDPSQQPGVPGASPPQVGVTGGIPGPTQEALLRAARERVQLPAMFLIAIGVLNLLVGLGVTYGFGTVAFQPADALYQRTLDQFTKLGETIALYEMMAKQMAEKTPEQ